MTADNEFGEILLFVFLARYVTYENDFSSDDNHHLRVNSRYGTKAFALILSTN